MIAGYWTLTYKTGWKKDPSNPKKAVYVICNDRCIDISKWVRHLSFHITCTKSTKKRFYKSVGQSIFWKDFCGGYGSG